MSEQACLISKQTAVSGNISGKADLVVEGSVEGKITLSNRLTIKPDATVRGDVSVESLGVDGRLIGDVQSTQAVEIGSGGTVVGDIRCPRVTIAEGAKYRGFIAMEVDLPSGIKAKG